MILREVIISNFRSYLGETRIPLDELTAFIGRNDSGKSSILEALEVFFNNKSVKISKEDLNINAGHKIITIGIVLGDIPKELVIDASSPTKLSEEYLLNPDGFLEIHKQYDCNAATPKERIYAYSAHPAKEKFNDLLELTITDLRSRAQELRIDKKNYNGSVSNSIRKAIFSSTQNLEISPRLITLSVADGKKIWEKLKEHLPLYALFKSDRESKDSDSEVQNPLKIAIDLAIKNVENKLKEIQEDVHKFAKEVADRTIEKLKEVDSDLADNLLPKFSNDPKWASAFSFGIEDQRGIPINKRGSGTRRLILLNFFRAEAERLALQRSKETGTIPGVIYAIEEPETSQHPDNQRMLIKALKELSDVDGVQVILTTHVPGLGQLLPISGIRYVTYAAENSNIQQGESILDEVAASLGVLPEIEYRTGVKVLICVEGPNDIEFLERVSATLNAIDGSIPSIIASSEIIIIPLGGGTLVDWVRRRYLREFGAIDVHIYDRGSDTPPKYQAAAEEVNGWENGSIAFLTTKGEMENYIHPDAIERIKGFKITFGPFDDLPNITAQHVHEASDTDAPWEQLSEKKQKKKMDQAKKWLNREVASAMSYDEIQAQDPDGDITAWLQAVAERI